MTSSKLAVFLLAIRAVVPASAQQAPSAHPFVHPGILQTRQNLEFMKAKVAAGEEPWKTAWENLLRQPISSLSFQANPVVHIARGSFGRASNGDRDLIASANAAYSHALQWYITGKKEHARKAIEVIHAWTPVLWDFEGNDAKLLAGWTGTVFCNAAEILLYTDSGWEPAAVKEFKRMLMTVYYPLLENYFPEANGNWDAAIADTSMAIGIFCDDRAIFDHAVDHVLRGPGNSGITKYIYPSGQCDENVRDQGHSQLGLGYFAQTAVVAWNQGVDLWSAADNRLALGFEYTARYESGEDPPAYGVIPPSARGRFSDIYEAVYQHYHFVKGLEMPYAARAIERTRPGGWAALTMHRGAPRAAGTPAHALAPSTQAPKAGAWYEPTAQAPTDAIIVAQGESIQAALDRRRGSGGWVVLGKGLHSISASLMIPSGVTLAGYGRESVLYLDPNAHAENVAVAIVNASQDLHDVTLRDFMIEGSTLSHPATDPNGDHRVRSYATAPSRGGVRFASQHAGEMRNLRFEHLTVRNCTHNGVAVSGASQLAVIASDFTDNGGSVVPGPGLEHDLLLTRIVDAEVRDSRFDDSPWGTGIDVTFSRNVALSNNETARNGLYGIHVSDSEKVNIRGNLAEGNDGGGIHFDRLFDGSRAAVVRDNILRNNGASGLHIDGVTGAQIGSNTESANAAPDGSAHLR